MSNSGAASFGAAKPLALHDLDDWQRQVGAQFALSGDAGAAPIALVAVKVGNRQPARMQRRSNFTAVFEMDARAAPAAGIYQVRHPEFGQASLYLEPTTVKAGKARMRASFN
ncbi:MAG: hypothetical protein V4574_20140 [Pseudomonadota bacterium]